MQEFILFLHAFSTGLLAPILSLVLLNKGTNLTQLSLVLGLYALSVMFFELPTGLLADRMGRKKSFLLAQGIYLLGYVCMLIGSIVFVFASSVLLGLGRALASGSLDALYIDQGTQRNGLKKTIGLLNVLSGLGLVSGALVGGVLPSLGKVFNAGVAIYDPVLYLRMFFSLLLVLFTAVYLKEPPILNAYGRTSLRQQVKMGLELVFEKKVLFALLGTSLALGIFLFSIETYWQPAFLDLPYTKESLWLLGFISFFFFGGTTVGNGLGSIFLSFKICTDLKLLIISRGLMALSLLALSQAGSFLWFFLFITLTYLFLGISNIPEGILLNTSIPSENRASLLSLISLILQMGGLVGSFVSSIFIRFTGISTIWALSAMIVLLSLVPMIYLRST